MRWVFLAVVAGWSAGLVAAPVPDAALTEGNRKLLLGKWEMVKPVEVTRHAVPKPVTYTYCFKPDGTATIGVTIDGEQRTHEGQRYTIEGRKLRVSSTSEPSGWRSYNCTFSGGKLTLESSVHGTFELRKLK